ncbi:MAG: dihydrolipoamide acetyltransferase family protein [Nannocystaceae bacterium]|nr:2-oxo acid dehydrogenase subunit E2 [bacterium]
MIEFKLPAIGEGVVEGEIVRWLKQPGDNVMANEPLVEVMTDKATVEIPSPQDAVVAEHKAPEGEIAAVGQVIAMLSGDGAPAAAPAPASTPEPAPAPTPAPAAPSTTPARAASPTNGKVLATPAARALAREAGIDLSTVPGDRGRITKADVAAAQAAPAPAAPAAPAAAPAPAPQPAPAPAPSSSDADELIPFRGMRRRIAEGMVKSYTTAVHYTYVEQIDVTKLVAARKDAKSIAKAEGVSLTYLPFIVKAVIAGLKKYPIVNAFLDEAGGNIVKRKQYNIGIATATEQGLMVPVLHDADRMSILDIAGEIVRVSEAAREGKASRDELTGSTFTITSLGAIGGVLATPILNHPEVGILGVHAIRKTPVFDENDNVVAAHLMNLSVSLDHRVVDGFEGASFMQEVKRQLENPNLLFLSV